MFGCLFSWYLLDSVLVVELGLVVLLFEFSVAVVACIGFLLRFV